MRFSYILIIGFAIVCIGTASSFLKPVSIVGEKMVEIPYGTSVQKSGEILKDAGVVNSAESYILLTKILHPKGITAGRYTFSGSLNILSVSNKLARGDFGRPQVRLTIPEGFTIEEIINRIEKNFPNIEIAKVKSELYGKEGYIYPETYFFDTDITAEELTKYLIEKSRAKLTSIFKKDIDSKEVKRLMIIASLLESEGRNYEERKMIAGIIDNRLKIDMLLQLDATLTYITGRGSSQLTLTDLKINSPYNTYVNKGLPPTPISSPGLESINAAINKEPNDYLFYLHDKNGQIYYARSHDEHVRNKNKYLR